MLDTGGLQKTFLENWSVKSALSALTTLLVFLAGKPDDAAAALGALMLLDLGTGIWANWKRKSLSSAVGFRKTLAKLAGYFIAVAVGNLIGVMAPLLGFTRLFAVTYLGVAEGISVLENLSAAGVKCLEGIAGHLRQTRERLDASTGERTAGDG